MPVCEGATAANTEATGEVRKQLLVSISGEPNQISKSQKVKKSNSSQLLF